MLTLIISGVIGCYFIIRLDWRRYGLLFLTSSIVGNLLCYLFTFLGFYSFPNMPFHGHFLIPYGLISTLFPFIVLVGVRYSPERWIWKIPFYWGVVHLGVFGEYIFKQTSIFKFHQEWDLWDSYTLWWIFLLLFELLGGKIIPPQLRRPIDSQSFRYGRWAWIVFHVIVIITIFLAGVYLGKAML